MAVSKNAIEIYKQILNGLGAPITEENLKFLIAWQKAEGGKATNNPFNTTYNLDADVNKTKFNSHGVKNYTTPEYGIIATVKTLKLPYYKNIVKGLQDNAGASNIASNIKELKTWGTGSLVAKVLGENVSVNTLSSENVTPNRSLTDWAYTQEKNWSGVKEWDPKGVKILKEYNKRMGVTYKPSEHWSAITISNAVMANAGAKTKDEMRTLGFNPTKSHSGYVSDAFKTASNSDYKYNRYVAEKLDGEYKIGDILVKGRRDGKNVGTSKWSYEDFANSTKGYVSHGDIIVNEGQDSKGKYVILAGGNLSNTYKNSKLYLSDIDKKKYKVKLNDTKQGLFISGDGNLIDQPKLNNKTESVEDVLETNVAENETLENDIDETLETDVDETNIVSQRDYDLGFGNDFRLSDSAQMALFGTVLYPKNSSNSAFDNISYLDLQNTNEEEDFELLKPESEEEIDLDLDIDVDVVEDVEDIESTKNEKAWWIDDKENTKENTKDITKKEYTTPKSMRALYLEGDITKKEYQEYLRTTFEFYEEGKKIKERLLVYDKKVGKPYTNSAGGISYKLTSDQLKKRRKIATDFANKYGYSTNNWPTDAEMKKDEALDLTSSLVYNGLDKDLQKFTNKYKEYNRLKEGFVKGGYDVDQNGNIISKVGDIQGNINKIQSDQETLYQKFDFSIGDYIPDESRVAEFELNSKQKTCEEKGLMWIPTLGKCGTSDEYSRSLAAFKNNPRDIGPQYAGSDGGFFFNTIFGAANLAKIPLTYAGEALWEAGSAVALDPVIDVPFDMYDGAFGTPIEQYNVRKKYLNPIINAKARYDKADGFLNGVSAFFGGDPNYWKEGGSIELNLNKKEVLNYAKNGYIVEELPMAKDGGGTYKYNNNYYIKDSNGKWSKEFNGRYYPLSKGDVAARSAILDKHAKKYYSNDATYSFKGRPEATYMKRDNMWFISLPGSGNKFGPINDPTGKRTKILNAQATLNNESKIQSEQNDKLVSAKEFQKKWMESPRYKEMLDESMKTQPYFAEAMNSARKYNLISTPDIELLPHNHEQADEMYGKSMTRDGQIFITPVGFSEEGTIPHEVSHSIDRPYGNFYYGERLIPKSDVNLIKSFKPKSFVETREGEFYKKYEKELGEKELGDEFIKLVNERIEEITIPSETRARLNDIRNNSLNKNIYNPFKEKVTPEIYKKLEPGNALEDLKEVYSDDQIIKLLNTISDAGNNQTENIDLFTAKNGGEFIDLTDAEIQAYRNGGYIVEEVPQDENGEQEPVGVSHLPPPSYYTYNNNKYAKRGTEWFKMINGNYEPLTAGNVPSRYKVLNKYATLVSKPNIVSKPEINESRIMTHLKLREGEEDKTYKDTKGYLTGGVGHKLTKDEIIKYPLHTTIPQPQIDKWLVQDSRKAINAAKQQAKELQIYDPKFVEALTAVNFQLGTAWNTQHKNTWRLMKDGAFDKAAAEAANSDWYKQTPVRVKDFQKALTQLDKLKYGGEIMELTDKEVEQYKAGGYIIEEYPDGGITGGPEYDSRYGILDRFSYKNYF